MRKFVSPILTESNATGSGKTYLAYAFGIEACKQRYKTKYVRLPDLLLELEMARNDGTYKKIHGKYVNPVLLIIDEWLLSKERNRLIPARDTYQDVRDQKSHLPTSLLQDLQFLKD